MCINNLPSVDSGLLSRLVHDICLVAAHVWRAFETCLVPESAILSRQSFHIVVRARQQVLEIIRLTANHWCVLVLLESVII